MRICGPWLLGRSRFMPGIIMGAIRARGCSGKGGKFAERLRVVLGRYCLKRSRVSNSRESVDVCEYAGNILKINML